MEKLEFLIILILFIKGLTINLITNGDFEAPQINPNQKIYFTTIPGWSGKFDIAGTNLSPVQFATQYVDMSSFYNGELRQTINIITNGTYVLALETLAGSFFSTSSLIYWDSNLLGYVSPTSFTSVQKIYFSFISPPGTFELSFKQIGLLNFNGILFDNFCLQRVQNGQACGITGFPIDNTSNTNNITNNDNTTNADNTTNNGNTTNTENTTNADNTTNTDNITNATINDKDEKQTQKENNKLSPILYDGLQKILSLPTNQMGPMKYLGFFSDDLWLYSYDRRNYNKTLSTVFETINKIEDFKWTMFNYQEKLKLNKSMIPITNMTAFSNKKHVEMDQVDDCFSRGALQFCLFTILQTVVLCLLLKRVFLLLFDYKVSIFFRRYYFMVPVVIQILLETNVPFFTYLFFKQASIPFYFNFTDKAFLAFSYFAYFWIFVLAFCLYMLGNEVYNKKFGYFMHCYYRCSPSILFLTLKYFIRGFLKGVIHAMLHYHYKLEITFLCLIDGFVIIAVIWAEKRHKIFLTKSMFCLLLLYHFHFIILNILLYTEQVLKGSYEQIFNDSAFSSNLDDYNVSLNNFLAQQPMLVLIWNFQTITIFSQAAVVVIQMIIELIPNDVMNPERDEWEDGEILGIQVCDENGNVNAEDFQNYIAQLPKFNLDANNPITYPNVQQREEQKRKNSIDKKRKVRKSQKPSMIRVQRVDNDHSLFGQVIQTQIGKQKSQKQLKRSKKN